MYKSFSKTEWIKLLKLPTAYKVDTVIIVGTPFKENHLKPLAKALAELNLNARITDFIDKDFVRCTEIKVNGKTIWFDTSYGSAYLSEAVHIGSVLGSEYNILLGSCGGLQESTKALDIILPTYSYGNESTTRLYQRKTSDNKHYSKEGYLGVEMEASSMFAVSNHFDVPTVSILHVNDNLVENEFVGSDLNISKKELKKNLILDKYKITLDFLLNHLLNT